MSTTLINEEVPRCSTCKEDKEYCLCSAWSPFFDDMIDPISLHDRNFKIVRANPAFATLLGIKLEEITGRHCFNLVHQLKQPCPNCPHQRLLAEECKGGSEIEEKTIGRIFYVNVSPICNSHGKVIGSVHLVHDLTDHYAAEAARVDKHKLAATLEMAGTINHELNQPLQVIYGYSEMIMQKMQLDDSNYNRIKIIAEQAERMRKTIRKMTKIVKYQTKDYLGETKIVDLD